MKSGRKTGEAGDEPLYSIGAVARMLGVSPSTLRGWEKRYGSVEPGRSKGAQRLYSRNEIDKLRFVKASLEAGASPGDAHRLLATRLPQPAGEPAPVRRESGQPTAAAVEVAVGGAPIPLHAHYPTFYATDQGRMRLALPFLRDGLRLGQPCSLVASGEVAEAYRKELSALEGVDAGALAMVDGPGQTVEACLAFWETSMWKALDGGASVIRVVGEMACERQLFASEAEMMRYELAYNSIARRFPVITLCQYDVREFRGEIVFEAFKAHPDVYDQQVGVFLS